MFWKKKKKVDQFENFKWTPNYLEKIDFLFSQEDWNPTLEWLEENIAYSAKAQDYWAQYWQISSKAILLELVLSKLMKKKFEILYKIGKLS